jgi:hypothetical protein
MTKLAAFAEGQLLPVIVEPQPDPTAEDRRRHEEGDERERDEVLSYRLAPHERDHDPSSEREPDEREKKPPPRTMRAWSE